MFDLPFWSATMILVLTTTMMMMTMMMMMMMSTQKVGPFTCRRLSTSLEVFSSHFNDLIDIGILIIRKSKCGEWPSANVCIIRFHTYSKIPYEVPNNENVRTTRCTVYVWDARCVPKKLPFYSMWCYATSINFTDSDTFGAVVEWNAHTQIQQPVSTSARNACVREICGDKVIVSRGLDTRV